MHIFSGEAESTEGGGATSASAPQGIMKRKKLELTITVLIYLFSAVLAGVLSFYLLREDKLTPQFLQKNIFRNTLGPLCFAAFAAMSLRLYDGAYAFERISLWRSLWKSLGSTIALAGIWAAVLLLQKNSVTQSRYYFVCSLLFFLPILAFLLFFVQNWTINHFYKTQSASFVLLATSSERAAEFSDFLKGDWYRKVAAIALLDRERRPEEAEEIDHIPVVAGRRDYVSWVQQNALDEIYLIAEDTQEPDIIDAVRNFIQMGISVHLNLPTVEKLDRALALEEEKYSPAIQRTLLYARNGSPMLLLDQPEPKLRYMLIKRLIDILSGIVGSLIALLLFFILGAAIKLESPGPVLFSQERIGKNGRKFRMYKFRSMYQDAEKRKAELMEKNEMDGFMFKMKDDPRITKVGRFIRKTSLDEFPQFFNVLRGDMSLIGTRPPTVNEFKKYSNYHKRRLAMKPGITGMWQASGRSEIKDFEDVVRLDCKYIDNWSLWLDLKILAKTILVVVSGKGSE